MKPIVLILVACILLATSPSLAEQARTAYVPGHMLVKWLIEFTRAEGEAENPSFYDVGKCWGFVAGVMDARSAELQISDRMTIREAVARVREFADAHPDRWDDPAVDLVVAALAQDSTTSSRHTEELSHDDFSGDAHRAHVHGKGQLLIALDGHALELLFTAPAADIIGFAHAPENEEQRDAMKTGLELLGDPSKMIFFPQAAGCRVVSVEIDDPWDVGSDSTGHADISVRYRVVCENPAALLELGVGFFNHFKSLEQIGVQAVGPNGQTADTLLPKKVRVDLAPIN